jgi:DnaJ family protein A protein 2
LNFSFLCRVSLEDLYLGSTKTVNIDRDVVCNDCKGYIFNIISIELIVLFIVVVSTGCNDGIERQCTQCEGAGIETVIYRMGPMIQQTHIECSLCKGQGNMIDRNNRCKKCYGKKLFQEKKKLDVNIVHGSQNGETIKFMGEGNQIVRF